MATTKLTLSIDRDLVQDAKRLALRQGTSLSAMFSRLLEGLLKGGRSRARTGPLTRKATGLVRLPAGKSDRELLEAALGVKYRVVR